MLPDAEMSASQMNCPIFTGLTSSTRSDLIACAAAARLPDGVQHDRSKELVWAGHMSGAGCKPKMESRLLSTGCSHQVAGNSVPTGRLLQSERNDRASYRV